MSMQQYCLRWNNHQPNFISVFSSLLNSESLVDVTLSAEGRHLQAHKLVLSACSAYFQSLFTINPCQHPIVILKDVKFMDLKVIIDFMYYGEVNVSQDSLPYILKTAEMLKIKGLAEIPVEASVKQNNIAEKTELLTGHDPNWGNPDLQQRQSMSPTPCPLSPGSKRKRFRKSSTGSGSGSTERIPEDLPSNDVMLTSPLGTAVIKPDPGGFSSDSGNTPRKQQSSESELGRGGSHESMESDSPHHITLQIPQQDLSTVQQGVEATATMELPGPSAPTQTVTGYQWGIVDHNYPHFTQATLTLPQELHYTNPQINQNYPSNAICTTATNPLESRVSQSPPPPQVVQKRKRSVNPQADENFVRALEAVRFGGIGFCKAARMYGVNNRTLWLEYKKRGYPISRLSIKNRKQETTTILPTQETTESPPSVEPQEEDHQQQQQQQQHQQHNINSNVAMISSTYIDGRPVEISAPVLQRSRYFDNGLLHTTPINLQGINFDQM